MGKHTAGPVIIGTILRATFADATVCVSVFAGFPDSSAADWDYEMGEFRRNGAARGYPLLLSGGGSVAREVAGGYLVSMRKDEVLESTKDSALLGPRLDCVATRLSIRLDDRKALACPGSYQGRTTLHLVLADELIGPFAERIHGYIDSKARKVPAAVYDLEARLVPLGLSTYGN